MALPLLLAGPIVRRVDARMASVWVACSRPSTVEIVIFDSVQTSTGPGQVVGGVAPVGRGTVQTRRMGPGLHIAVTMADGTPDPLHNIPGWALRPGAVYGYDIVIQPEGGEPMGLLALGLLADEQPDPDERAFRGVSPDAPRHLALGYSTGVLPSFVTPAGLLPDIRIAHTSCRKTVGPGSDAMAWLDKAIAENRDSPTKRIQQLFLTGDQIYADDVPSCLLPMYHDIAMDLMGTGGDSGEEELPSLAGAMRNINMDSAPPLRRTRLIRTDGGFTSVESQNHLLTVGEYAACYLTAWNPRIWRALGDEDRCYTPAPGESAFSLTDLAKLFTPKGQAPPMTSGDMVSLLKDHDGPAFAAQRQRVITFAKTVAQVARVLANTPTYMIFDDHDVTDDWNINRAWMDRVNSRPLGKSVVRNALIAYTFFQAWGNDWRAFADPDSVNGRTLATAEAYLATTRDRPTDKRDQLDRLFDLRGGEADRIRFDYTAPGSVYQVRVLDSRTRRTYPVDRLGAPDLLGESLDQQVPKNPAGADIRFTLVVAATPVLGPDALEHMIWPAVSAAIDIAHAVHPATDSDPQGDDPGSTMGLASGRTRGAMFVDVETFPANQAAQHRLLSRLAEYGRVVVLGGDVHYGCNLHMDWWERDPTLGLPARTGRIVQLTSSAARNAADKDGEALFRGYHWLGLWGAGMPVEGLGWARRNQLRLPDGATPSMLRRRMLHAEPSIVPNWGWPRGTTEIEEPHWRFRQVAHRDTRPNTARPSPFQAEAARLASGLAEAAANPRGVARAQALAGVHSLTTSLGFAPLRDLVLTNNVGLVKFEEANGKITVVHTLMSTTVQGYPEDKVVTALPSLRPFADTAIVSPGAANTEVRIPLDAPDNTLPNWPRIGAVI